MKNKKLKMRLDSLESSMSNIDDHINRLNKESIETNIIIKSSIDSWLKEYAERWVYDWLEAHRTYFIDMKIKKLAKIIDGILDIMYHGSATKPLFYIESKEQLKEMIK